MTQKEYIEVNRKVYDALAEEYEQKLQDYLISDRKLIAPFISYLKGNFKKIKVLELGPGSGLALSYFEKEGFDTTAIDFSKAILQISKKVAPNTKYLFGDFLNYEFGKLKFNGIFAKAFIHLFPKDDATLVFKKISDLLAENGVVYIDTTIHDESKEEFFEKSDYNGKLKRFRKMWTENELLNEINKSGFSVIKKYYDFEPDKNKKWIDLIIIKNR